MKKPHVAKTLAPIHFEDLDPHRFEDLVRELVYDFRDWQSLETIGRTGNDDGFDLRAFERVRAREIVEPEEEDGEEPQEPPHPMDGNLWMIQAKREKELGPKRVSSILSEIDTKNPPYGYILAAAANFSKDSQDLFRDELRKKGVMEFYLWGAGELEGMLLQPKNDRILFAFFGISLVTRQRTRVSAMRSTILTKNKLLKLFGGGFRGSVPILVRDIDDTEYPHDEAIADFKDRPRWNEYEAFALHPRGIAMHVEKRFAYLDRTKNEWDYTKFADLLAHHSENFGDFEKSRKRNERRDQVVDTFTFLPLGKQATYCIDGLIEYENIRLVDDKGDEKFHVPHLFAVHCGERGPFFGFKKYFEIDEQILYPNDEFKKIGVFPASFELTPLGTFHSTKPIALPPQALDAFKNFTAGFNTLWDVDGRFAHLQPRDYAPVTGVDSGMFLQITHREETTIGEYLKSRANPHMPQSSMRWQLGNSVDVTSKVVVLEFRRFFEHHIERLKQK
jgi:hypothetical protein